MACFCCRKSNAVPVVVVVVVVVFPVVFPVPIAVVLTILIFRRITEDHPCIISFWRVVDQFTDTQKRQLLKFVTSCSRPPLLGFKVGLAPSHITTSRLKHESS